MHCHAIVSSRIPDEVDVLHRCKDEFECSNKKSQTAKKKMDPHLDGFVGK